MSTILDALKKSEQGRNLNKIPTLSDMPIPEEKSSRWPIIVLLVLLIVAAVIVIWLLLDKTVDNSQSQAQTPSDVSLSDDVSSDEGVSQNDSVIQGDPNTIEVNIISYSQDANQRFVIIDGKMFREGAFIKTGLKVQSIDQDSVTLNDRGELILRRP